MTRTPYQIQVRRRTLREKDAHGNREPVFGDPEPWRVSGIAPGYMGEGDVDRDLARIAYTIYAPTTDALPDEHDRVLIAGTEYEVSGRPSDWTQGPWPMPQAGSVTYLRRIEG